jgi:hypothetical protein
MGRGGEGVFIGPESSGRPAKVAYVRYLSIAVQRLFRTSRYYSEGIPKSSVRPRKIYLSISFNTYHSKSF